IVFQQTLAFADYQVTRLRWRGQVGGLLPGGFDARSIAQQAILEFLQQCPHSFQVCPQNGVLAATGSGSALQMQWNVCDPDSPKRCERFSLSPGERPGGEGEPYCH